MNYQKIISKVSRENYKFYFNPKNSFYISFEKFRSNFLKKKFSVECNQSLIDTNSFSLTYKILNKINKDGIKSKKNQQILFNLYKRFEIDNIIFKEYDNHFLKKKSTKEAEIETYILLNKLILKLENINKLNKLNVTLKLNDKILLNYNKIKIVKYFNILTKNIISEKKMIASLNV